MPLEQPLEPIISLYGFYTRQTTPLQKIGYSPKEAFWVHFACLPFLSWDNQAQNEIRSSQLFELYLGIYSDTVDGGIKPKERPAFIKLLEKRYEMALVPTSTEGSLQSALEECNKKVQHYLLESEKHLEELESNQVKYETILPKH